MKVKCKNCENEFIICNGENISLGSFDHIQDAINARKCAEVKYFEYKQSIMRTD